MEGKRRIFFRMVGDSSMVLLRFEGMLQVLHILNVYGAPWRWLLGANCFLIFKWEVNQRMLLYFFTIYFYFNWKNLSFHYHIPFWWSIFSVITCLCCSKFQIIGTRYAFLKILFGWEIVRERKNWDLVTSWDWSGCSILSSFLLWYLIKQTRHQLLMI